MGCIVSSMACCVGSAACGCISSCCPTCRSSTTSRIMYSGILLLMTAVSLIIRIPGLSDKLKSFPGICKDSEQSLIPIGGMVSCESLGTYLFVYKVCFPVACFFFLMSLIMIEVRSSKDIRAPIQNGFWLWKYLIVIAAIIGSVAGMPDDFAHPWMIIAYIFAFIFIIIQLLLLVDFAHTWNETWLDNAENKDRSWMCGIVFFFCLNFIAIIAGNVLLYVFYTKCDSNGLNIAVITINLILCVVVSVTSILPGVQEHNPHSGLLQSSVISLYCTYLIWSGLAADPSGCNPLNGTDEDGKTSGSNIATTLIGIAITFFVVLWSVLQTSSSNYSQKLGVTGEEGALLGCTGTSSDGGDDNIEEGKPRVYDNEEDGVAYSYSFFHFMFMIAVFYLMLVLTDWWNAYSTTEGLKSNSFSKTSLWVKITSSWICYLIYCWTLVAPAIFPDRDFGYT